MNADPAKNQLLDEVLADAASPAFRADLLRLTLERVHSLKQQRRRNRGVLAAACVLLVLATAVRLLSPSNAPKRGRDNPLLVHSRPLEAQMLVVRGRFALTPALSPGERERVPGRLGVVRSSASTIARIRTSPTERTYDVIGDDQLFAMLGGRPAALIRRGPAAAELVLLDPADRDGFPVR